MRRMIIDLLLLLNQWGCILTDKTFNSCITIIMCLVYGHKQLNGLFTSAE